MEFPDLWDIMSGFFAYKVSPPAPYGMYGPGLNAANMRSCGWLDRSRVLTVDAEKGIPLTVELRPLHARELPGYLALEIGDYIIEFRDKHNWDLGIPRAAVFVHSFSDNHSYLEPSKNGSLDLQKGDSWDSAPELPGPQVVVEDIDTSNHIATLTVTRHPGRKFDRTVGGSVGIPWVDGGGFIGGSVGQLVVVQPGDDLIDVVDYLVAFRSVETLRDGPAREAVQRAAMEQLGQYAEAQLGRLNAENIRTPAPLSPTPALPSPDRILERLL